MKNEDIRDGFEDDGRTIADMSGVTRRNPFGFVPRENDPARSARADSVPAADDSAFTRKERVWEILGALKAVLLIGLCFAVGLALVILLFYL